MSINKNEAMFNFSITRPHKVWLESRCFRVIGDLPSGLLKAMKMVQSTKTAEMSQSLEPQNCLSKSCHFRQVISGVYEGSIPVPRVYYGYICGLKNHNREELEKETNTKIILPKHYDEPSIIAVIGENVKKVQYACMRISSLIKEKRNKSLPTHFISIPANSGMVRKMFLQFKQEVMKYEGIDELLFQTPMRLHLTLSMLTILDISEQDKVLGTLQNLIKKEIRSITKGKQAMLHLRGVKIMHDDPCNVEVLYANVEEGEGAEVIRNIARKVTAALKPTGFLSYTGDNSDVKLHVTLINAKFKQMKLNKQYGEKLSQKPLNCSFDASKILQNFKDYDFGFIPVYRMLVAICGSVGTDGAHDFLQDYNIGIFN